MANELICNWLDLPSGAWPPDHHTLLGLAPGESDMALIEQRVFERMEIVRRYQLTHPEAATEAMNCLAKAMVCLMDPALKTASQTRSRPGGDVEPAPPANGDSFVEEMPKQGDLFTGSPSEEGTFVQSSSAPEATIEQPDKPSAWPEASNPVSEAAWAAALSGGRLNTRRALYYRIARTRQLIRLWELAGQYLNQPARYLKRPTEATELIHAMKSLHQELQSFPLLLGQAGQPGYLVLTLARQHLVVPTFQTLLPSQREALARDWQAGRVFLLDHAKYWRQELRSRRKRGFLTSGMRLLASAILDHPGVILFVLGLLALNLSIPEVREVWHKQVIAVLAVVLLKVVFWWTSSRFTRVPTKPQRQAKPRSESSLRGGKRPAERPRV